MIMEDMQLCELREEKERNKEAEIREEMSMCLPMLGCLYGVSPVATRPGVEFCIFLLSAQ